MGEAHFELRCYDVVGIGILQAKGQVVVVVLLEWS